jgi:hypothetical protein
MLVDALYIALVVSNLLLLAARHRIGECLAGRGASFGSWS